MTYFWNKVSPSTISIIIPHYSVALEAVMGERNGQNGLAFTTFWLICSSFFHQLSSRSLACLLEVVFIIYSSITGRPCFSRCGPWTSSSSITQELLEISNHGPYPSPTDSESAFYQDQKVIDGHIVDETLLQIQPWPHSQSMSILRLRSELPLPSTSPQSPFRCLVDWSLALGQHYYIQNNFQYKMS